MFFRVHTNEGEIDFTTLNFGFLSKTHYTSEKCPLSEKNSSIRSKANIETTFHTNAF